MAQPNPAVGGLLVALGLSLFTTARSVLCRMERRLAGKWRHDPPRWFVAVVRLLAVAVGIAGLWLALVGV